MIEIRTLTIEARVPGPSAEWDTGPNLVHPSQPALKSLPDEVVNRIVQEILKQLRMQKEDR